ncbi:MAG: folate-binding protein [Pseudomonadota bacterium]
MPANEIRVVRLDFLGALRVTGADADVFLQGQLSNDIRKLTPELGQLSSYNSPKGRMLAALHLQRDALGICIELHRSVLESVQKRLRMFVLRSKVAFSPESEPALGVMGTGAAVFLRDRGLPVPETPLACATANGMTVMRRIGAAPRFSIQGAVGWTINGIEDDWKRADIEAGVPTIYPQTQDHFVPQWCNLDQLGGISFDKGCYTGQEIVARIHYLGEVKRRMKAIRTADCAGLTAGAQTEHGEIVDVMTVPEGGCLSLVVQRS